MTTNASEFDELLRTLGFAESADTLAPSETIRAEGTLAPTPQRLPVVEVVEVVDAPGGGTADFVLREVIGEGGMGSVYLAEQSALSRPVALKRGHELDQGGSHSAALMNEALATGALEHPNIVPVHLLGDDAKGRPVLVMKRVEGVVWSRLIHDAEHPAWGALLSRHGDRVATHVVAMMGICDALMFAHSRGVLHRDVKPDNVILGEFGEVYLLDWGIALRRATRDAGVEEVAKMVGTPRYMAPEMVAGFASGMDERTDVFLLGATLHEALTRAPRHGGTTFFAVLRAAFEPEPVEYPKSVPVELARLCNAATAKRPEDRPASVRAFREGLAEYLQHRASVAASDDANARMSTVGETSSGSAEAFRSLLECRFGFAQALRFWGANPDALDGQRRCLRMLAEREVVLRNPKGARDWLHELPAEEPEMTARVAGLEAELEAERASTAAMETHVRDRDLGTTAVARQWILGGMLVFGTVGWFWNAFERPNGGRPYPVAETWRDGVGSVVVLGVIVAVFRRRLLANKAGRTVTLTWLLTASMCACSDLVFVLHGDSPARMAHQCLIGATALGMYALEMEPSFGVVGVAWVAAAMVIAARPEATLWAVATAMGMLTAVVLWEFRRQAQRR